MKRRKDGNLLGVPGNGSRRRGHEIQKYKREQVDEGGDGCKDGVEAVRVPGQGCVVYVRSVVQRKSWAGKANDNAMVRQQVCRNILAMTTSSGWVVDSFRE